MTNTNTEGTLAERAMLVDLSIGYWEGRRKDVEVTEETTSAKNAASDAGAWWTRTLPASAFKDISAQISKGRTYHIRMTLPWDREGRRVLPASSFLEYSAKLKELEAAFHQAVNEFLAVYPSLVEGARKRLGELYRPEYFPSVESLRRKFYWRTEVLPIPTAGDFRIEMDQDRADEIRRGIEEEVKRKMAEATRYLWDQLYRAVDHMLQRLTKEDGILRGSLTKNIRELCDGLRALNLTNDPDLEEMRKRVLEDLGRRSVDEMRTNKTERKDAAEKAAAILDKMASFGYGKVSDAE